MASSGKDCRLDTWLIWLYSNFNALPIKPLLFLYFMDLYYSVVQCSLSLYLTNLTTLHPQCFSDFAKPKGSEREDKFNFRTTETFIDEKRSSNTKCTFNIGEGGRVAVFWGGGGWCRFIAGTRMCGLNSYSCIQILHWLVNASSSESTILLLHCGGSSFLSTWASSSYPGSR